MGSIQYILDGRLKVVLIGKVPSVDLALDSSQLRHDVDRWLLVSHWRVRKVGKSALELNGIVEVAKKPSGNISMKWNTPQAPNSLYRVDDDFALYTYCTMMSAEILNCNAHVGWWKCCIRTFNLVDDLTTNTFTWRWSTCRGCTRWRRCDDHGGHGKPSRQMGETHFGVVNKSVNDSEKE